MDDGVVVECGGRLEGEKEVAGFGEEAGTAEGGEEVGDGGGGRGEEEGYVIVAGSAVTGSGDGGEEGRKMVV